MVPDPNYQPGDVKAVFDPNAGITSNYFGGVGAADGPGHGHYNVDLQGNIQFQRPPGEKK